MINVGIVTSTRAEFGLLRPVYLVLQNSKNVNVKLIVSGTHLSKKYGYTLKDIIKDNIKVDKKISIIDDNRKNESMADVFAKAVCEFDKYLKRNSFDTIVLLGDRYETLAFATACMFNKVPITHLHGGETTEGAIDDEVRNAVTMMSSIHFPGVIAAGDNIHRMLGTNKNVYAVGEVGLDSFNRLELWDKNETAKNLNLDLGQKWCLVTLHPETKLSLDENLQMVDNLFNAMKCVESVQYIITKANTDFGGLQINEYWEKSIMECPSKMQLYPSLGQHRYLSFMKHADMVVGNSSSGIVEAPFMGTPVVNIGDRQKGRNVCKNVICCGRSKNEISEALNKAMVSERIIDKYWGDGHSSERIVEKIKEYLNA